MKKNIRIGKRHSAWLTNSSWSVGLVSIVLMMGLGYVIVDSKCKQLSRSIGNERHRLQQKVKELRREQGRWSDMNTRASLDAALVRHGLAMQVPHAGQTVRMGADGTPVPGAGAIAVARLREAANARIAGNEVRRGAAARAAGRRR